MTIVMTKRDYLNEFAEGAMVLEPGRFDEAVVGIVSRIDRDPVVCYSVSKIIEILMEDGMDEEEAYEYYEYNILGAYMGETTPMFLDPIPI
jgi:hypothetical protein